MSRHIRLKRKQNRSIRSGNEMSPQIIIFIISLVLTITIAKTTRKPWQYPDPNDSDDTTRKPTTTPSTLVTTTEVLTTEVTKIITVWGTTDPSGPPQYTAAQAPAGSDYMTTPDRIRMCNMIKDLYFDAHLKSHQLRPLISSHRAAMAFEVGTIMGIIRERYRRMMQYYREYLNKEFTKHHNPRTFIRPPGIQKMRTVYAIVTYELIHEIEWDIQQMIEVMESIPPHLMDINESTIRPPSTQPTKSTKYPGADADRRRNMRSVEEERYKSRLRQSYILRRLGMDEHLSTTKKRFQRGWPVEDTWDHLQY